MKIALAQMNSRLGDFEGNKEKILTLLQKASEEKCDLMITPELSLFGYTNSDLMEYPEKVQKQLKVLATLEKAMPKGLGLLVGAFTFNTKKGKPYHNSAFLLRSEKKAKIFSKKLLPSYDVFDELRYVEPGKGIPFFKHKGKKIALSICEDIWAWEKKKGSLYSENPWKKISTSRRGDLDLFINISASPFTRDKHKDRYFMAQRTAKFFKTSVVFVNRVGGEDELIFDGRSFILDQEGKRIFQCPEFKEALSVFDFKSLKGVSSPWIRSAQERLWQALVLGISDFVKKTGFKKVHLGLSGGVDSALVSCLASEAVGAQNVTCIGLPSRFNSPESLKLAQELSQTLGTHWKELSIDEVYEMCRLKVEESFGSFSFGLVDENLQSRIRSCFLMAFGNKEKSLLLNTTNKSELAVGYGTLYGDLAGGLSVIGDLLKSEVFDLAKHFNQRKRNRGESSGIPLETLRRPPSAELKPGQTDEKELALPYSLLDKKIEQMILRKKLFLKGADRKWTQKLMKSEFKRWQAPPILKVSERAFGKGRRFPLAQNVD